MFFSRYFSGSLQLQRDQPAQAGAVLRGGDLGLVEDLDLDVRRPCRSAPGSRPAPGRPCALPSARAARRRSRRCSARPAARRLLGALGARRRRCAWRVAAVALRRGPPDAARPAPAGFSAASAWNADARLRRQLGLQRRQVAPDAELAAVLVDHAQVHEQVRRQLLELEVGALHVELRALAHAPQQRVDQAALARTASLGDERRRRTPAAARSASAAAAAGS